jgi:hypothetical protein
MNDDNIKQELDAELKELWRENLDNSQFTKVTERLNQLKTGRPGPFLHKKLESIPLLSQPENRFYFRLPAPALAGVIFGILIGGILYSGLPGLHEPETKPVASLTNGKSLDYLLEDIVIMDDIFDKDVILLEKL